jgi:hypothetical protein
MGTQEVGAVGSMLEDHRGEEQVLGVGHGASGEQLLHPTATAPVPLGKVSWELAAPVGLVLLVQDT